MIIVSGIPTVGTVGNMATPSGEGHRYKKRLLSGSRFIFVRRFSTRRLATSAFEERVDAAMAQRRISRERFALAP